MKKELLNQLKSYSLAAGAILATAKSDGKVVYTDINPDNVGSTNGDFYDLDLNNDLTIDFKINLNASYFSGSYSGSYYYVAFSSIEIQPMGNNAVASSTYYGNGALALAKGVKVNNAQPWVATNGSIAMANRIFFQSTYSSYSTSFQYSSGNWVNANDKYLGLRLNLSGKNYYGWARLDVAVGKATFTIKDYAYDNVQNRTIITGGFPACPAENVIGKDVDDNSNGADVEVTFDKAANEATVNEYRIIIVKNSKVANFDVAAAAAVAPANFTSVTPNGSNVVKKLIAGDKDSDGDPIIIGVEYRAVVLSKPDGVTALDDEISLFSPKFTLYTTADVATNVVAADVSDFNKPVDLQYNFDKAADESGITEYRVLAVPAAEASTFTIGAAQAVPTGNYHVVTPNGSNQQGNFTNTENDTKGGIIEEGKPYRLFILSMSNGTTANVDSLSGQSNEITLSKPPPWAGIDDLKNSNIKVYANHNQVFVNLNGYSYNQGSIKIMDISGKVLLTDIINNNTSEYALNVAEGMYVAVIELDGKVKSEKLFISR